MLTCHVLLIIYMLYILYEDFSQQQQGNSFIETKHYHDRTISDICIVF